VLRTRRVGVERRATEVRAGIAVEHALIVHILRADHEVARAVGEPRPESRVEAVAERILTRRDAALRTERQPFELLVEHDVDHTADRARAPGRRRAAGDDLDPTDQALRHGVEIACTGEAAPVEQGQGTRRAKAAKVGWRRTRSGAREVGDRRGRGAKLREIVQHLRDARAVALQQGIAAQHRGRRRRVETRAIDARSGDDQFALDGRLILRSGGGCRLGFHITTGLRP